MKSISSLTAVTGRGSQAIFLVNEITCHKAVMKLALI